MHSEKRIQQQLKERDASRAENQRLEEIYQQKQQELADLKNKVEKEREKMKNMQVPRWTKTMIKIPENWSE